MPATRAGLCVTGSMSQLLGGLEQCEGLCQQLERGPWVPGPVFQVPATGVAKVKQMRVSASAPGAGKRCPTGPVCQLLAWKVGGGEGAGVLRCIRVGVCNLLADFKLDKLVSRRPRVQAGILNGSRARADSQGIWGRGACERTHIC